MNTLVHLLVTALETAKEYPLVTGLVGWSGFCVYLGILQQLRDSYND